MHFSKHDTVDENLQCLRIEGGICKFVSVTLRTSVQTLLTYRHTYYSSITLFVTWMWGSNSLSLRGGETKPVNLVVAAEVSSSWLTGRTHERLLSISSSLNCILSILYCSSPPSLSTIKKSSSRGRNHQLFCMSCKPSFFLRKNPLWK